MFRYIFVLFLCIALIACDYRPVAAQEFILPNPGKMVNLSPAFDPALLRGIKIHPEDPFRFDFILDQGDQSPSLEETNRLVKYFLASLTIPEGDLWVNLSPYEKGRIIPSSFGLTEMGRDLLAEDYVLKQVTASLIYPEGKIGKEFWRMVYQESQKKFGTTNIPINTFNKVWILPQKAVVYENGKAGTAYITSARLKVMLEQDYLSSQKHSVVKRDQVSSLGSQIIREIVIPKLTQEVNEDKNFYTLRQVYYSLILATWYKKKIRNSILTKIYEDRKKIVGVDFDQSTANVERIYRSYLQAFKKGVYSYIKEEQDPVTRQAIPKKYFSGGMAFNYAMSSVTSYVDDQPVPVSALTGKKREVIFVHLDPAMFSTSVRSHLRSSKKSSGKTITAVIVGLVLCVGLSSITFLGHKYIADQTTNQKIEEMIKKKDNKGLVAMVHSKEDGVVKANAVKGLLKLRYPRLMIEIAGELEANPTFISQIAKVMEDDNDPKDEPIIVKYILQEYKDPMAFMRDSSSGLSEADKDQWQNLLEGQLDEDAFRDKLLEVLWEKGTDNQEVLQVYLDAWNKNKAAKAGSSKSLLAITALFGLVHMYQKPQAQDVVIAALANASLDFDTVVHSRYFTAIYLGRFAPARVIIRYLKEKQKSSFQSENDIEILKDMTGSYVRELEWNQDNPKVKALLKSMDAPTLALFMLVNSKVLHQRRALTMVFNTLMHELNRSEQSQRLFDGINKEYLLQFVQMLHKEGLYHQFLQGMAQEQRALLPNADAAMIEGRDLGGINLQIDNSDFYIDNDGEGMQLNFDPAMLDDLQQLSGLKPVIFKVQTLTNLSQFLEQK